MSDGTPHIGTLREGPLHAALKRYLAEPGDRFEQPVGDYVADIVRGERLIEIQTGGFSNLKGKLAALLPRYAVQIVLPIAERRWIARYTAAGDVVGRRRSPKRGRLVDAFDEVVFIADWLSDPHLSVQVLMVDAEERWVNDGRGSWRRRGWSRAGQRLLAVNGGHEFGVAADWLALLPHDLPVPFSNRELADGLRCRMRLAQRMSWTLTEAGVLGRAGKQGNAHLFAPQAGA